MKVMEMTLQLPNLFILGAPKCGTTSLAFYLSQHQDIFIPSEKECHFFDVDEVFKKGPNYFHKTYLKDFTKQKWCCDASPSYLSSEKVVQRVHEMYGSEASNLKFIVMLRDPVQRAWSHYLHRVRDGVEDLSFSRALQEEGIRLQANPNEWCNYFSEGLYGKQIEQWFSSFDQEQFLILPTGRLKTEPLKVMDEIFRFLGVENTGEELDLSPRNEAGTLRWKALSQWLHQDTKIKLFMKKILPVDKRRRLKVFINKQLRVRAYEKNAVPVMDKGVAIQLQQKYMNDQKKLKQLIGWNCNEK